MSNATELGFFRIWKKKPWETQLAASQGRALPARPAPHPLVTVRDRAARLRALVVQQRSGAGQIKTWEWIGRKHKVQLV